MIDAPIVNVYAFVQDGCDHCAKLKVELKAFEAASGAFVALQDVTYGQRSVLGFTATITPTVVFTLRTKNAETGKSESVIAGVIDGYASAKTIALAYNRLMETAA